MSINKDSGLNLPPERWAEIFVHYMHPDKIKALRDYFTLQDQKFHSERCEARRASGGRGKSDH